MNLALEHDHSELEELLTAFFSALDRHDIDQSFDQLDRFWARLAVHIRAEHLHLFPTLLRAVDPERGKDANQLPGFETITKTIDQLRADHDFFMTELAAAMKQLRVIRQNKPPNETLIQDLRKKTEAVRRRLDLHNHREETGVYPWSEALLSADQLVSLNQRMQQELAALPARLNPN